MAEPTDSSLQFFTKATPSQWSFVLGLYKEVLRIKAQERNAKKNGPEELIKLDNWYQEQLPKNIKSRKDPLVTHEELVQITKWKLMRGKHRPRLIDLVRINTETAVTQVTKKAFRKLPNLSGAMNALTTLKGIGPATASAVLAAAFPEDAPFMADESMLATPGVEATDYTLAEYLNYAEQIKNCAERLKAQDPNAKWNPHKVELTLWTHYLAKLLKASLLEKMPTELSAVRKDEKADNNSYLLYSTSNDDAVTKTNGNKVLDDDSNISSTGVVSDSNDEKSSESVENDQQVTSSSVDATATKTEVAGNGAGGHVDDSDSKDCLTGLSSDENSRNNLNEESSNSILSSEGLEPAEKTDSATAGGDEEPALKKQRVD